MHAMVCVGMSRRPDWNYEEWDAPVNPSQTAGTLMLFSLVNLLGCRLLGLRFTRREREAVCHLWRYVGSVMGVHPDLLPADESDNWRLLWLQADYELRPDNDSRALSEALVAALPAMYGCTDGSPRSRATARLLTGYNSVYSRLALGKTNSDTLGLADSKTYLAVVLATAAVNAVLETVRRFVPGATRLSESAGHRAQRATMRWMAGNTGGDRTFGRHDHLADNRQGTLVGRSA